MNPRLVAVARILRRVLSVLAALVVLLVLAGSLAVYLAATGTSLPILRVISARVGRLGAGQRTEHLVLDVRVMPAEGRLAGTATLTVRSLDDTRQRFYFLLNDGLRVRDVRVAGVDTASASAYQLSLLTVVDIGTPVAKGNTVQLTLDYDGAPATGMFSIASNFINPQQVLLNVDAFWYPNDAQSFFTTEVTATVPNGMTVVHNGVQPTRVQRGDVQQVHWTSERPVAGLSLVAGPYDLTTTQSDGITYRLYLPRDVQLDSSRIVDMMAVANRIFDQHYGSSGFKQLTLFVSRDVRRGFNDGSGLMGLSIRYFRAGDYGFALVAHEIAHNWWGSTVAERWLSPGTGGEWIVEGFAEFSSLVAAEAVYGTEALTRRLAGEFFDPDRQAAITDMSVLDNALAEATARDTIYRKGAYVAMMLRRTVGEEAYFRGLRQFLERFRYQQATDRDMQQAIQEVSPQNLDRYFTEWVRSDHLADLSLDGTNMADVTVNNLGTAPVLGDIDLWTFKKTSGDPMRTTVHVGDTVPLDPDADYAVLDPLLAWADVQRGNNRYPRRHDPVYVAASAPGEAVVTDGEVFPWVHATVSTMTSGDRAPHTWDFDRGLTGPPAWSPDGASVIVGYSEAKAPLAAVVTLATDGTRRTVGHGSAPAGSSDGSVYAAEEDRIVRCVADGSKSTFVKRPGESLDMPLPSPDGSQLVYTAARGNHLELHAVGRDGHPDRLVMSCDRDRLLYRWSKDGTRLYAIVGGNWDWQIWEIPLGSDPVQVLVQEAAVITDLAVSPDGDQLAFTAAPALDYPVNRRQLYVLNLHDRAVRTIVVPSADPSHLTWASSDSLLVVATMDAAGQPWMLPANRTLKRVRLSDGSIEDAR